MSKVLGSGIEARPVGGILRLTGVVLRREPGGETPACGVVGSQVSS